MTLRASMVTLKVAYSNPNVVLSAPIPAKSPSVFWTIVKVGASSLGALRGRPETL